MHSGNSKGYEGIGTGYALDLTRLAVQEKAIRQLFLQAARSRHHAVQCSNNKGTSPLVCNSWLARYCHAG